MRFVSDEPRGDGGDRSERHSVGDIGVENSVDAPVCRLGSDSEFALIVARRFLVGSVQGGDSASEVNCEGLWWTMVERCN
uniref:Uncharacterized protein n=2 Tax=Toxoplasma gondii TaxID=5811 RepID=A0A2T6IJZ9_TOXGO|nr:hypothetical protein TGBR9_205770 [Toxoplasma gondii TgCATBr9]